MRILIVEDEPEVVRVLTSGLQEEGHTVTALDLQSEKIDDVLDHPNLTFLRTDIRTPESNLERLISESDLVIDLIAYANPGLYIRIPLEVFRLNFTENLKIAEIGDVVQRRRDGHWASPVRRCGRRRPRASS